MSLTLLQAVQSIYAIYNVSPTRPHTFSGAEAIKRGR